MNTRIGSGSERSPEKVKRTTDQKDALFCHLLASRPARERRTLPWLIAAVVQIPVAYFFFASSIGEGTFQRAESIIRPIFTQDDKPADIFRSVRPVLPPATSGSHQEVPEPVRRAPLSNSMPGAGSTATRPDQRGHAELVQPELERLPPPLADPGQLGATNPTPYVAGATAARDRVAERLIPYNDSIAAERLATERGMSVETREGKRWGISPGKFHLGDITLKLSGATNNGQVPDVIVPPAGRRAEITARVQLWHEIEVQSGRAETRDIFDSRVKEIRNLQDRQRRKAAAPGK